MKVAFPILHDPDDLENTRTWFTYTPIIGWIVGSARQFRNEARFVSRAIDRGIVPESEWEAYEYSQEIRRQIEKIVIEHAYPENSTFHPLDPFELMIVLRYGDLNEVEIVMELEKEFGFDFTDEILEWLVEEKVTFIDFIRFIEARNS